MDPILWSIFKNGSHGKIPLPGKNGRSIFQWGGAKKRTINVSFRKKKLKGRLSQNIIFLSWVPLVIIIICGGKIVETARSDLKLRHSCFGWWVGGKALNRIFFDHSIISIIQ